MYTYTKDELKEVLDNLQTRINSGDYIQVSAHFSI